MRPLIVFFILSLAVCSNRLVLYCDTCASLVVGHYCFWMEINGKLSGKYVLSGNLTCDSLGYHIPSYYIFDCDSTCQSGCSLTSYIPSTRSYRQCSSGVWSQSILNQLDYFYSISIGDMSTRSKNNWCQCDKKDPVPIGIGTLQSLTLMGKVFRTNSQIRFATHQIDDKNNKSKEGSLLTPFKNQNFYVYAPDNKKVIANKVFQDCNTCYPPYQNYECLQQDSGAIFYEQVLDQGQTCSNLLQDTRTPAQYTFSCDETCDSGCYVKGKERDNTFEGCLEKGYLTFMLEELDKQYSLLHEDFTLQKRYDWCACGSKTN